MIFFATSLFVAAAAALIADGAQAQASAWADIAPARLRLFVTERTDEAVRGGIEVELPPGWKTYWRTPGDAGIPPRFDVAGSRNIKSLAVSYPYPERYFDGAFTSLVYSDHVILPFEAALEKSDAPTDLALTVELGICEKICIPARAEVTLSDVTGEVEQGANARIAPFERSVPVPAHAEFGLQRIERRDGGLLIKAASGGRPVDDILVEAPASWGLPQPERRGTSFWLPIEAALLDEAAEGTNLRFTIIADGRAVEETVPIAEIR